MTNKYLKIVLIYKKDLYILSSNQLDCLIEGIVKQVNCKVLFNDKKHGYLQINAILTDDFIHNKKYKTMSLREYIQNEQEKINLLTENFKLEE